MANEINIYGQLHAATSAGVLADASEIKDTNANKSQETINSEVQSQLDTKQDKLVSGTNIKTINGLSVLGKGRLDTGLAPIVSQYSLEDVEMGDNFIEALHLDCSVTDIFKSGHLVCNIMNLQKHYTVCGYDGGDSDWGFWLICTTVGRAKEIPDDDLVGRLEPRTIIFGLDADDLVTEKRIVQTANEVKLRIHPDDLGVGDPFTDLFDEGSVSDLLAAGAAYYDNGNSCFHYQVFG